MKEGNAADQLQVSLFTIWEFSRHGILLPRTCSHLNFVIKYQSFKDQFFVIKIKKKKKTFNYQKAIKEIHHLHQIFLASYQKQRQSFQYMFFGHTPPPCYHLCTQRFRSYLEPGPLRSAPQRILDLALGPIACPSHSARPRNSSNLTNLK